ncbi:hypothetical protein [Haloferula sargassicola]|uniref:Transposase n=1 Tax=Haloferula sargassicola TaxID=490096 RepID=A0ABP9UVG3_9BACT
MPTQALAYVKSNSGWANRYEAIKKLADKVRGVTPPKPGGPDPEAKARETGEQSYVEIASHLKNFTDRLEALATLRRTPASASPPSPRSTPS